MQPLNRILTLFISSILSLSLTACSEAPGAVQEPTQNTQPPSQQVEMQSPLEIGPVIDWEGWSYKYTAEELEVISGAGHGFNGDNFDLAMGYLFDYLASHIN